MREINDHLKHVMGVKPKQRFKKDYTKAIVWFTIGAIAVVIWTTIYNLIF